MEKDLELEKKIAEFRELLITQGIILHPSYLEPLQKLGFFQTYRGFGILLEDILVIILEYVEKSYFLKMFYCEKQATIFLDTGYPSTSVRAEEKTFVNAAGKFLLEAMARGIISLQKEDILKIGMAASNYHVRSHNLSGQGNWLVGISEKFRESKTLWQCITSFYKFHKK